MLSISKIKSTVFLASATLLCTSPLVAAIKTKPSNTRVKSHTVSAPHLRAVSSKASSSKAKATSQESPRSSSTSARKSAKTKTSMAGTHGARKARVVSVSVSKPKYHGQQSIDEARTIEIQQALIREHYLYGEATGEWDQPTRDALFRFQNDNHWQTKVLPDARALIKLGLGPSQQRLLNPESAAVTVPYQLGIEKPTPAGSN